MSPGKVLGEAGKSIPDVYDVDGSVVDIDRIDGREIKLVHEMGATILSERLAGEHFRIGSGPHLQNVDFEAIIATPPGSISRIVALQVLCTVAQQGRTARVAVVLQDGTSGRETPVWIWETGQAETEVEWSDSGQAVATFSAFQPTSHIYVPSMLIGVGHAQQVQNIILRGTTGAFGAGNITYFLMAYLLFPTPTAVNSFGLPIPSW